MRMQTLFGPLCAVLFCNGILLKMFDSFVQLVVYSFSVEMYFRMDIVSIDVV